MDDKARRIATLVTGLAFAALLGACTEWATLSVEQGSGPHPVLPAPVSTLLPTVNIAPAEGWSPGQTPTAAAGLRVSAFARDLDHPRWLLVLPNGDVLVAETNAPVDYDARFSIKTWATRLAMKRAGAGVASADRISLLRDGDGDGVAEMRRVLLGALPSPFGMALIGERLFVATADALLEFPYHDGETTIAAAPIKRLALPGGPINHHWTKNLLASQDGQSLYIAIGSNSNVAERDMAVEAGRAAIWRFDLATGAQRIFATGLRNPVGMSWDGSGARLWTVVNERDELGSDLVPDYLTAVHDGAFYGWPYSYYGRYLDPRAPPAHPALARRATVPDYALGPHTASLGLTWSEGEELPPPFRHGMFIGQHGSWNRRPLSGYRVIFVPFAGNAPAGLPIEVLGDFVDTDGRARGRPVGVQMDRRGGLLVADDVGNVIWRVTRRP